MKRFLLLLFFCQALVVNSVAESPGWKLVWADEFNKPGPPDAKNWNFENGFVRNLELQWYQRENAYCKNGRLTIEARREKRKNPAYKAGSSIWQTSRESIEYTSSSIITKGLHQWQYGRFEVRGRIDTRLGMWPAFWTLGVQGEWPSNGEVDVMEFYRNMLLANVAWGTSSRFNAEWSTTKKPLEEFHDPDWSKKFHIWRMDWDKDFIKLYVDDVFLNSVSLSKTINGDGSGKNPFHQPHYLLLNLAVGGQNGGDPSGTSFPGKFEVDYVRVYQKLP